MKQTCPRVMETMRPATVLRLILFGCCFTAVGWADNGPALQQYCDWQAKDFAIEAPLCGLSGDPVRGRALAADSHAGNCLACHQMPIPEESFHGTVGPPLDAVGARYTPGQIRLRIVDEQQINPMTIMPGFYRDPKFANRMADAFWGKTFLTAQQVEDLVAYLVTLK